MASSPQRVSVMAPEDKIFYQQLGQRIAQLRKAENLTQQQLAETLGIAQQTLAHYEGGRLRVSVVMLPALARALAVSVEELIGEEVHAAKGRRGPAPKLQQQLERISQLPKAKQRFVIDMLDTVLQQAS